MTDECAKVTRRLGSNRIWQGPLHEQSRFSTSWALVVWWCQVHGEAAVSAMTQHFFWRSDSVIMERFEAAESTVGEETS